MAKTMSSIWTLCWIFDVYPACECRIRGCNKNQWCFWSHWISWTSGTGTFFGVCNKQCHELHIAKAIMNHQFRNHHENQKVHRRLKKTTVQRSSKEKTQRLAVVLFEISWGESRWTTSVAVNPACNASWKEHADGDVGNFFWCGRREKEPRKFGVSGENKAMQRKIHYFWGADSKYLGPESRFLKVSTLKAWEGLVVGKIWCIILLVTSQHTGRGSHPSNGGDKIKLSNLYFWCIKQIHFPSGPFGGQNKSNKLRPLSAACDMFNLF